MGAGGSRAQCEELCRHHDWNSKEVRNDDDSSNLNSIGAALCGGAFGVSICDSPAKSSTAKFVTSEDLPFFVLGCGDQPPPSRWRRFNQKHRRAPRVPPLRLPIRKAVAAAVITPKTAKAVGDAAQEKAFSLTSGTRCQRRPVECPNAMPRLPRIAKVQILRKDLSGCKSSDDSAQNDSSELAQGAMTSVSEFNAGEEALESAKAISPAIVRSEEGVWVDVELNESAQKTSVQQPSEHRCLVDAPSPLVSPVADEDSTPALLSATALKLPWSIGPQISEGSSCSSSKSPSSQANAEADSNAHSELSIVAPREVSRAKVEADLDLENQDPNIPKVKIAELEPQPRMGSRPYEEQKVHTASPSPLSTTREAEAEADKLVRSVPRACSCLPHLQRQSCDSPERKYQPWSDELIYTVSQESKMAMWVNSPEVITFFLASEDSPSMCSTRPPSSDGAGTGRSAETQGASEVGSDLSATDRSDLLFLTLAEVADRPFPLELLLLSTAFARLVGTGAGESTRRPMTVNSGHHEVEALLLKYTAFASRRDLRRELEAWFPARSAPSSVLDRYDLAQKTQGACDSSRSSRRKLPSLSLTQAIEGPDNDGPSLSFEALAAFISTHAAPRSVLAEAFASMAKLADQPCGSDSSGTLAPRKWARQGLEAALVPLLAGLPAVAAGNGRGATLAAKRIACCAAVLALRGHDRVGAYLKRIDPETKKSIPEAAHLRGSRHWLGLEEFVELFGKAASIARLSTMHLTGDTKRWQNCIASPSPRVDLRCAALGGA